MADSKDYHIRVWAETCHVSLSFPCRKCGETVSYSRGGIRTNVLNLDIECGKCRSVHHIEQPLFPQMSELRQNADLITEET